MSIGSITLEPFYSYSVIWSHYRPFDRGIEMPYQVLRMIMGAWPQYRNTFESCYLLPSVDYGK